RARLICQPGRRRKCLRCGPVLSCLRPETMYPLLVSAIRATRSERPSPNGRLEPLENGARLSAPEFLRRYEAMPQLKKAELIEGTVYMPSPVRFNAHSVPDALIQTWLGNYAFETPGTQAGANGTLKL